MKQEKRQTEVDTNLGDVEAKFADIVWKAAPMQTAELVEICARELGWKRTTTYTVLKKFCNKNVFSVEQGRISVLVSREEFYGLKSKKFVEKTFGGSLPAFLSAFISVKKISEEEIEEIKKIISDFHTPMPS